MNSDYKPVIQILLAARPDIKGIYLFGSRADGTASPGSDYDFAFLTPGKTMSVHAVHQLRLSLATMLDADVDLIDLQEASTVLQFQIISKGLRIFSSDDLFCDTFDVFVFSSYQHLNEGQQDIIHNIKQQGKVYA